ncbi:SAM-dependent methyltransferase [Aestuariibius insulae]|uniref:SAM-dependent methyltransferase n=1 Tax=Aestuariibius insulae TaxID=2058287 RepID=UPI00345F0A3E
MRTTLCIGVRSFYISHMSTQPPLFDQTRLERNRQSATEMFLQERAADGIQERLAEVNRTFTAPAIVTPFPQLWRGRLENVLCVPPSDLLSLGERQHDLVVHSLSLHAANDPVGQLVQARLALKPDGLMIATTFGGQTLHELRASLAEAEIALTGGLSPRVSPMADIREFGGLLQRAGFTLPVADRDRFDVQYRDLRHLLRDLKAMGEGNAQTARQKTIAPKDLFSLAERIYRDRFSDGAETLTATFEMITLTGWAPAPDQPVALRPGSASHRLAEALNTTEVAIAPDGLK